MSQRKIIILDGESDKYMELGKHLLQKAMNDPDRSKVIRDLIEDDELERGELFATAYAFAVLDTVYEMQSGRLKTFNTG